MRKLRRDIRGAVTIIVTIMLIPALLVSGTAVDLARIHTAKSMLQDANNLAANAALTQYDALLQDLYGLYGVLEGDPILSDMINKYVQVAVYGEDPNESWIDTGLGSFQSFQGSSVSAEIQPAGNFNLENRDVLRRQIEEYMKFRGPVILVDRLLNDLDIHGGSIKATNEALEQQKKVAEEMGELFKLYEDLYNAINRADKCNLPGADPNVAGAVGTVARELSRIKDAFSQLESRYKNWEDVCTKIKDVTKKIEDEEKKTTPNELQIEKWKNELLLLMGERDDYAKRYDAKRSHIAALAGGGSWRDWSLGRKVEQKDSEGEVIEFDDGSTKYEWQSGNSITGSNDLKGLETIIKNAKDTAESFKANFTAVVTAGRNIDSQRERIRTEIATLKQKMNNPNCEKAIKDKLAEQIKAFEELLDQFPNIEGMAKVYQTAGNSYIDEVKSKLDSVEYGDLSPGDLTGIASNTSFALAESIKAASSKAAHYAGLSNITVEMPDGFKKFNDAKAFSDAHAELYKLLAGMASTVESVTLIGLDGKDAGECSPKEAEKKQKNIIQQLVTLAQKTKDGLANNPQGAKKIADSSVANGSWGSINIGGKVIDLISNPGGAIQEMADWVLLMTYDVGMFSNYTTQKPAQFTDGGKTINTAPVESEAGIPMSPKVNYFYQSEWEYLLVGNKDAGKNLSEVKTLIYDIRLICNGIATFSNSYNERIAKAIQAAVSAIPYVGPALGWVLYFATHAAFAAGESAVDLAYLRNGCKVELLKLNEKDWKIGEGGINDVLEGLKDGDIAAEDLKEHNKETGISYEQYMLIFFLVSGVAFDDPVGTLTDRTGNLIEWNVINYGQKVNASNMGEKGFVKDSTVDAMSAALAKPDCFRLKKAHTDFNITTTMDLRLLFLAMPMFKQQGSPFSNEFRITATDFRGY